MALEPTMYSCVRASRQLPTPTLTFILPVFKIVQECKKRMTELVLPHVLLAQVGISACILYLLQTPTHAYTCKIEKRLFYNIILKFQGKKKAEGLRTCKKSWYNLHSEQKKERKNMKLKLVILRREKSGKTFFLSLSLSFMKCQQCMREAVT